MIVELLHNEAQIRRQFTDKFLLTFDEYIKAHPCTGEAYSKMGKVFDEVTFHKKFMWDKLNGGFSGVTQEYALDMLKSMDGDVLFISEGENFDGSCELRLDGQLHKGFLVRANAIELAELIEHEWFESWKCAMKDQYYDCSLPEDLYVFDESMDWVIVFTHEGDGATMKEQMNSRYCTAYGLK